MFLPVPKWSEGMDTVGAGLVQGCVTLCLVAVVTHTRHRGQSQRPGLCVRRRAVLLCNKRGFLLGVCHWN